MSHKTPTHVTVFYLYLHQGYAAFLKHFGDKFMYNPVIQLKSTIYDNTQFCATKYQYFQKRVSN